MPGKASSERRHPEDPRLVVGNDQGQPFPAFIEQIPFAIAILDREMKYIVANKGWRELYGLDERDYAGQFHHAALAEPGATWRDAIRRVRQGERVRLEEDRFVRSDGLLEWQEVELNPWRDNDGSIGGYILTTRVLSTMNPDAFEESVGKLKSIDINHTYLRAAELIEAQRLSHVGSWIWDSEHDIAWWSPEYFRILGLEPAEEAPPLREQEKFYTPETMKNLIGVVTRLLQTGQPYEIPLDIVRPDGTIRNCIARGERAEHRINILRGTLADVTELRRLELEKAALERERQRLEKFESLGRLAGAVAHHFNNHLMTVMGNLEMALSALPDQGACVAPVTEYLAAAMQAAGRGTEVSRVMLTYLGQRPVSLHRVDLADLCAAGIDLIRAGIPAGSMVLPPLPGSGPVVEADPAMMQEALSNLLINAWEAASGERNIIRVRTSAVDADAIPSPGRNPVTFHPEARKYACLEVSDSGVGIAPDAIRMLFDPFYSTKFTGRGLGLPTVLGIVQMHKGVVTVESRPGRGSIFRLFIPAAD